MMAISVLGAGAWGTAVALAATRLGHDVTLWCRNREHAHQMQVAGCNQRYLPNGLFPNNLHVADEDWVAQMPQWLLHSDLIVVATPMAGLREALKQLGDKHPRLAQHDPTPTPVIWLCKGMEQATGLLGHEVCLEVTPHLRYGLLSGPSFAAEVAIGSPTAVVAASPYAGVRQRMIAGLHSPTLRLYDGTDVMGVEVGGVVKNILAIATGVCDGLGLGSNARAALITRGLAEMKRLGVALGGKEETFAGLTGLGDLVLTATGDLSRNRRVGLGLAKNRSVDELVSELGHVSEGVYSARTVVKRAKAHQVEMPICQAVVALLEGKIEALEMVHRLMAREQRAED